MDEDSSADDKADDEIVSGHKDSSDNQEHSDDKSTKHKTKSKKKVELSKSEVPQVGYQFNLKQNNILKYDFKNHFNL